MLPFICPVANPKEIKGPEVIEFGEFYSHPVHAFRITRSLSKAGMVKYTRGRIEMLDIEALKDSACECYETVKVHYAHSDRERSETSRWRTPD
jgi:hypothetical protein